MGAEVIAGGSLAMSVFGAAGQASASKSAAKAAAKNAVNNAMGAGRAAAAERYAAEEQRRVGGLNAERTQAQAESFKGSQRVLTAAQGFLSDSGTAEILQQQTTNLANADALATLESAGQNYVSGMASAENLIKSGVSSSVQINENGQAQAKQLRQQAFGTLLGGFASFAGSSTASKMFNTSTAPASNSNYNNSAGNNFGNMTG